MQKRFKTKKKILYKYKKIFIILFIIYISYYVSYNIIYNLYLKELSNKEIIEHIISNSKNNNYDNPIINKYKNPHIILSNNFSLIEKPTIKVDNQPLEPQVLIYSTHDTEKYKDKYLEVYNIKPTVKTMSYILEDYLSDLGITGIVEPTSISKILKKNNWSYKYSYKASRIAIEDDINKYSSLELIIDLHRDSSSLSKTLLEKEDSKYARILFVIGGENKKYKENLQIAESLRNILEKKIPGITRGILTKKGPGVNGIYNQDLSTKCILIELGGQYNEIEELNNTIKILSEAILEYLEGDL